MNHDQSHALFARAQQLLPGGVNSPVRAFRSVGGTPLFFQKGVGSQVQDADGRWYTDYVGSWGPMILGHAHPEVIEAVQKAVVDGLSFGAPTEREVDIADYFNTVPFTYIKSKIASVCVHLFSKYITVI